MIVTSSLRWFLMAALSVCATVACNEGDDTGSSGDWTTSSTGSGGSNASTAKQFYIDKVHPTFDLICTYCHATGDNAAPVWAHNDAETSYVAIDEYGNLITAPSNSLLLLQGEHAGPALVPQQKDIVREWLELETKERGLSGSGNGSGSGSGGGTSTVSAETALSQIGDCMNLEVWNGTMAYIVADGQTVGWGPCRGCHNTGWGGAFLDDDTDLMFSQTKKLPFLLKWVTAKIEDGVFKDIVPANRFANKGTEKCTYEDETLCHPNYVLPPSVQEPLDEFVNETIERWKSGTCDDPYNGGAGGGGGGGGGAP